jgi:anti-sigma factor ChrR (cupin superfamily)
MSEHDKHPPDDALLDDALIGRMAEAMTPAHPDRATAERMRARLLVAARAARPGATAYPTHGAAEHLTIRADAGEWIRVAPGVRMKLLREDDMTRSYLLRMRAGAALPAHDHDLDEECMVLEGDVWLGEVHARAGDFHLARRDLAHGEIRSEAGCLLFLRGQKGYAAAHAG